MMEYQKRPAAEAARKAREQTKERKAQRKAYNKRYWRAKHPKLSNRECNSTPNQRNQKQQQK
jgi:hypothetical protein